jgi:hypothetical protein
MKYEDFLETLTAEEHEGLAKGEAFVGDAYDGLAELVAVMKGEREQAIAAWNERLAKLETQEEAAQLLAHLIAFNQAGEKLYRLACERVVELHRATCSHCSKEHEGKTKAKRALKRGLDAARQAFLEALDESDEPWRGEGDDE